MRPIDIAIVISTLELNPDPKKADVLREEIRRALQRQEISPQTYAETLALLKNVPGLALGPMPETV
jgi:hypothetical protein